MVARLHPAAIHRPREVATPAFSRPLNASPEPLSVELPRRNAIPADRRQPETASGFVGWLGRMFREHRAPVGAVLMGAAAVPFVANSAPAQPAPRIEATPAATGAEAFDPARLTEYPLFKLFWQSPDSADGTSHDGLDEVTRAGVDNLVNFARAHNLDGTPRAGGREEVSEAERQLLRALLENPHYGSFFELDALPHLYESFGIPPNAVHSVAEQAAEARAALATALGLSAADMKLSFPNAGPTTETSYLSMDGAMAEPMRHVDLYRAALGLPIGAEAHEKAPVLGWIIGQPAGHTKHGSFTEEKPFSTSGLNWGTLLFPGNREVASLPPKSGFEFPIDILNRFNDPIGAHAVDGDRLAVIDGRGRDLAAEPVIHRDDAGKAVSWSAVFRAPNGVEVPAQDVVGVIKDRLGHTKGDGEVTGSMDMGWWGFCDRNTAGRLYKSKFGIPNVDRDVRLTVNGTTLVIPMAVAQKLLDVDVTDMVGPSTLVGARFDDNPVSFQLKSGESLAGRLEGSFANLGAVATRVEGDDFIVRNTRARPLLGGLTLDTDSGQEQLDLSEVEWVKKKLLSGAVEVKMRGEETPHHGKLLTHISFQKAEFSGLGKLVLRNTPNRPIFGEYIVDLGGGEKRNVRASEVTTISMEMQTEMPLSDYLKFVIRNGGMYATDNSKGSIVSNGMRWLNRIHVDAHQGTEMPSWAKDGALGLSGPLERKAGDKLLFIDGLYKTQWSPGLNSQFSGWLQLDASGGVINEGFLRGEPDFGWASEGPLDWNAPSTFNPLMPPELRLQLLINGVSDLSKLESLASKLNFPANWRELRLPEGS